MNVKKVESTNQLFRMRTFGLVMRAKSLFRILSFVVFLMCTIGTSSVRAQFTTIFAPALFNTSDPGNTNWNEPKNWSWYPGTDIGSDGAINIVLRQACYINSFSLKLNPGSSIEISEHVFGNGYSVTFTVQSQLENLGRIFGSGELVLQPDAFFNTSLQINDGTIECSTLNADVDLFINRGRIICFSITCTKIQNKENGKITSYGFYTGNLQMDNNARFNNHGTLQGLIELNNGDFYNNAVVKCELVKPAGGNFYNSGSVYFDRGTSKVRILNNYANGKIIIDESVEMNGGIVNEGLITNNDELTINSSFQNSGTIVNNGGKMTIHEFASLDNSGTITNNYGNIYFEANFLLNYAFDNSGGIIDGSGTLHSEGQWINKGTLSPGNSPGELNHTGNYTEQGTLQIELGGTTPITNHDVHTISGAYDAGGTLTIILINGFVPAAGNSFRIVTAGSRTGNYAAINLPNLLEGLEWGVEYNSTNITLRVAASIVPVTWLDFTVSEGEREDGSANLAWSTAEEINNLGFEVERSEDGRSWEQIGFEAARTAIADQYDYKYIDLKPKKGINYYRLKQVDYDGAYEYSVIRSIELESKESIFSVYPNPSSTGHLNLSIERETEENLDLSILDLSGRIVYSQKISADRGANLVSVNNLDLSSGTYIIRLSGVKQQSQMKWVKL